MGHALTPRLVRYLACAGHAAVLLMPLQAAAQQPKFQIKADVRVREDSFACKETSDLDRLLQINQRGGFTSGTQLYDYLRQHNCIGLTEGSRPGVRDQGAIRLHLRSQEQEQGDQALRLDTKGDAAEMKTLR